MKKQVYCLLAAGALLFGAYGCGRGGSGGLSGKEQHAFDKAAPELAQAWTAGVEAAKTNDYFGAEIVLYRLMRQGLTPEQKQAVEHQLTIVSDRLTAALEKGDPAAQAALEQLRSNPPNRIR